MQFLPVLSSIAFCFLVFLDRSLGKNICKQEATDEDAKIKRVCEGMLGGAPTGECAFVCALEQMDVIKKGRVMKGAWSIFLDKKLPPQFHAALLPKLAGCSALYRSIKMNDLCDENREFFHCVQDATDEEKTKLCALKIANKNQQDAGEGLMGFGEHGILQPVCDFLPKGKRCYKESFQLLEKCFPVIQDNAKIFELSEILVNIEKALCSNEKNDRIRDVLGDTGAAMPALACGMQYYKGIGDDMMECPIVKKILMNPNFLSEEDNALCNAVDEIEDCLLNTLDMCENSGSVKKFVHKIYDILIGVAFRCDGHENF